MIRTQIAAALTAALAVCAPALAQSDAPSAGSDGERVNQVIVYGDDPCPRASSPDEITVCARKSETERYRIPEQLRGIDTAQSRSWTDRVKAYETVGNFGTMSCSPVGAGGFTGCTQQLVRQAYAEKQQVGNTQFSDLIAKERAKRLSTIDADAAATQARVEAEERDYTARQDSMAADDAAKAKTETQSTPTDSASSAAPAASASGN